MSQPLFVRSLTETETTTLHEWITSDDSEKVHRAKVILYSASGKTAYEIGTLLSAHPDNLKKWIREFNRSGLEGITIRKRGPQGKFTPEQISALLELHHQSPRRLGYTFDYWTPQKLADAAVTQGIVSAISHVTMRQILREQHENGADPSSVSSLTDSFLLDSADRSAQFESEPFPNSLNETDHSTEFPQGLIPEIEFPPVTSPNFFQLLTKEEVQETSFERLYAKSQAALRRGDYRSVCQILQSLLDHPNELSLEAEAEIRCWLSEAFEGLGQYQEALSVITVFEDPTIRSRLSDKAIARARLRLGWVYARLGMPKAFARLNEALRAFIEQEDYEGMSAAHNGLGWFYCNRYNEFQYARDHLDRALAYEQLITNQRLLAQIYLDYGIVKFNEGAFADATRHYQKALQIARQIEDHRLLGLTLMNLGVTAAEFGKFQASAEYHSAALAEFKRCAEVNFMARTYNNLADGLIRLGKWSEGERYLTEALSLAERLGAREEKVMALITSGELRLLQGRLQEAEEVLQNALSLMTEGDKWLATYTQRVLAQVYHLDGRIETALKTLRSALQLSTSVADVQNVYRCHLYLAELHLSQEGYDQAEEYLELAREQVKSSQDLTARGHLQRLEGQLAAVRGRLAEAQQHVEQSISIYKTLEDKHKLALSILVMGQIRLQLGEVDLARSYAYQAREAFAEMGAAPDLARAEALLEQIQHGGPEFRPLARTNESDRASGVSDLLLIARLMEAATSRDLLLQELASILHSHFDIQKAIVWEVQVEEVKSLVAYGLKPEETSLFIPILRQALHDRRSLPKGQLIHMLEDSSLARVLLWLESRMPNGGFDMERLKPYLKQAEMGLEYARMRASLSRHTPQSETTRPHIFSAVPGFIYASQAMSELIGKIQKIRTSDVPVLITGESGTGKELIARAIHVESSRRDNVFLPFNCTTSTRDMIDSQLFGYRRGAFTGAFSNHVGIIRAAENGTLFLDEIGDLALEVQPKLLRFLQEGEIQPLGETMPIKVDVRVIAATNADLERAVEEGRFREDLYYRLNVIHLHVPPLRDRREEIPLLAAHYLEHFMTRDRKKNITFSREAFHALSSYSWPGNVRQLRTEIQRVVAYTNDEDVITPADLSTEITSPRLQPVRSGWGTPRPSEPEASSYLGMPRFSSSNPISPPASGGFTPSVAPGGPYREPNTPMLPPQPPYGNSPLDMSGSASGGSVPPGKTLREVTDDIERKMILDMLAKTGNNVSRTARELGLSRRGLKLKMEQLGIDTGRD